MCGSKSRGVPSEKQSAPTPRRAAFSKVDGLPHAIQSGGGGRVPPLGRALVRGVPEKKPPEPEGGLAPPRGEPPRAPADQARPVFPAGGPATLDTVARDG